MRERPILFSAPMVRAILAGKKTQTRRIVKPQPEPFVTKFFVNEHGCGVSEDEAQNHVWRCPYGIPGDRLWVRETWFDNMASDDGDEANTPSRCVYRANGEFIDQFPEEYMEGKWTPSIHMPRWASRITLEVVAVRVERLQEISGFDLTAEGFPPDDEGPMRDGCRLTLAGRRQVFAGLWEEINGADSWSANPWVWVVEFKRI